jgi:glycosyltransferase involved in cell wall biosynthesis
MNVETVITKKTQKSIDGNARRETIELSALVVCRDFAEYIETVGRELITALEEHGAPFEIIFVDDGSLDQTFALLSKMAQADPCVRVIKMRSAFGEASSFDAALQLSRGSKIIYFTARVLINPKGILKLLEKLDDNSDLVVGWRYPRRDSLLNQFISRIFNMVALRWSTLKLHDINSGILVARRDVLENVPLYGDLNNFIPLLALRQGYKVAEEKIEQMPGKFRQSRYENDYLQRFLDIITVIFLKNYSKKPLHFLGFLGAIFTIAGAGINLYLFVYRILGFGAIAGRPLLLLGALLLVIGIQMISIGLVGEMVIFTHAKDIKEYNIEKIL